MLLKEFLEPLGVSQVEAAKRMRARNVYSDFGLHGRAILSGMPTSRRSKRISRSPRPRDDRRVQAGVLTPFQRSLSGNAAIGCGAGADQMPGISRRQFVAGLGATAALGHRVSAAQDRRTRLILLGTGGGPRPRTANSATAQVIVSGGKAYVVDCGDGVARQLVSAGILLATLRHVFITHQHSDHNADYGNLVLLAWTAGLRTRVDTWGPPPLERMTRLFFEMNQYDIDTRISNEGRVPLIPLVSAHELRAGGAVMSDEQMRVTAALVDHPPVVPAFAYRFDARDRSIVISGDTAPSQNLVKLAAGADVLVHSVMYPAAIDRLVAKVSNAAALKDSILAHQTSAEDAGRIAQEAGVRTLVLSHFVPPDDPAVTESMWAAAARRHFRGTVIVGRDLLEV
jgi:ribonuclease BN (tRNA processing enzyme)